jgi:LacI family transcriptional regulator
VEADRENTGVIALVRTPELMRQLLDSNLPCVNVSGRLAHSRLPYVTPDQEAVGAMAAAHLLERRYRNFIYVGDRSEEFSRERGEGFSATLAKAGCSCEGLELRELPAALERTPKPLAIMTYLDDLAPAVMSACRTAGLEIPSEVAIVGVNNDEVFCELTHVPLSSVDPNAQRVGREAAALLDRILGGDCHPSELRVPPRGVVVRSSSDYFALEDADLAKAVHFIQQHACDPMTVNDILPHTSVSRRTLEYRFRDQFGRSLHDEIRRVQLERAKQLLVNTDLTIASVGERSGFAYANRFSALFRDAVGMPPGEYRKTFRRSN